MSEIDNNPAAGSSGLFGIKNSNRKAESHWGKNSFNSSFPTSVACFMLENNIPAIYNRLIFEGGKLQVSATEISLREVFNCRGCTFDDLEFCFESRFEPYQHYSLETIDGIDLVVKHVDGGFLSPLEVKLTVLPDNSTYKKPEEDWGSEMVVRSATTSYCALGMFDSVSGSAPDVRGIFEDSCADIGSWTNDFEMSHKTQGLASCIDTFQRQNLTKQKPLVMQVIWKTQGQSPFLSDNAFDIVVWSDYAFSRLFVDRAQKGDQTMSRHMRATAKLARCMWELSKSGRIRLAEIYRQMAFDNQTDKEFSINGQGWRKYISSERLTKPILPKEILKKVIGTGYIERLRPERRFDQTLYFTMRDL